MTRKGGKRKAGLNKSILSVGLGTLNQMITYKIEQKGGLVLMLPTQALKPSQRCPQWGGSPQGVGRLEQPLSCLLGLWV